MLKKITNVLKYMQIGTTAHATFTCEAGADEEDIDTDLIVESRL